MWRREADPDAVVGRRGLVAELGQVEVEAPVRRPDPARAREPVEHREEPRQVADLGLVAIRVRVLGAELDAVRVVAEGVGARGLEVAARAAAHALVAAVHARHARAGTGSGETGLRVEIARCPRGASSPSSTWAPGSARSIAGRAARTRRAVEVRRGGRADAARHARLLRLEPARDVRLVPDQVAVDAVAVARGHGARELPEQRRARLVARVVLAAACRSSTAGPGP